MESLTIIDEAGDQMSLWVATDSIVVVSCIEEGREMAGVFLTPTDARKAAAWLTAWADHADPA